MKIKTDTTNFFTISLVALYFNSFVYIYFYWIFFGVNPFEYIQLTDILIKGSYFIFPVALIFSLSLFLELSNKESLKPFSILSFMWRFVLLIYIIDCIFDYFVESGVDLDRDLGVNLGGDDMYGWKLFLVIILSFEWFCRLNLFFKIIDSDLMRKFIVAIFLILPVGTGYYANLQAKSVKTENGGHRVKIYELSEFDEEIKLLGKLGKYFFIYSSNNEEVIAISEEIVKKISYKSK